MQLRVEPRGVDGCLLDVDHIELLGEAALTSSSPRHIDDVGVGSCRFYDECFPPSQRELGVDWSLGEIADQNGLLGLKVRVPGARLFVVASSLLLFRVLRVLPGFLAQVDQRLYPPLYPGVF